MRILHAFVGLASSLGLATLLLAGSCYAQDSLEQLEQQAISRAVAKIEPSVVQIETIGGLEVVDEVQTTNGPVTGLVVSADGHILTSSFNLIHQPAAIFVRTRGSKRTNAEVIAVDKTRNLTLLKIDPKQPLTVPQFANVSDLEPGTTAIAVGRIYDLENPNISTGIISATNRIWSKAVQTDAKISPANFGGPLIDLRGRVIGILAPMSESSNEVTAGSEWYDSGIGFAIPLQSVLRRLEKLAKGNDLRAGLLGVDLKGSNIYADPAEVAVCLGGTPASKSGLRSGDVIVEVNGTKITRQAEFKHAIGPLYEGDEVKIVAKRGGELKEFKVELAGELPAFDAPALGLILTSAESNEEKAPVRTIVHHVLKESPAEKAGFKKGDKIVSLGGVKVATRQDIQGQLIQHNIGDKLEVVVNRDAEELALSVELERQTAAPVVDNPARTAEAAGNPDEADSGIVDIKVADASNKCFAIVPKSDAKNARSLLVWVPSPGTVNREEFTKRWKTEAAERNVIVLVPESLDPQKWDPGETEFFVKAIELLRNQHSFETSRVVIGGKGAGGAMASIVAFAQRPLFRGLILTDCGISDRVKTIETIPTLPLMVWMNRSDRANTKASIESSKIKLQAAKFPLHETEAALSGNKFRQMIVAWVDAVDRL